MSDSGIHETNLSEAVYNICINGINDGLSITKIQDNINNVDTIFKILKINKGADYYDSGAYDYDYDNLELMLQDAEYYLAKKIEERKIKTESFLSKFKFGSMKKLDEEIKILKNNVEMIKNLISKKYNLVKILPIDVDTNLYLYNGEYVGIGVEDKNKQGNIEMDENGLFKIKIKKLNDGDTAETLNDDDTAENDGEIELYEKNDLYIKKLKTDRLNKLAEAQNGYVKKDEDRRGGKIIKRKTIKRKMIKKKKTKRKVVKKG